MINDLTDAALISCWESKQAKAFMLGLRYCDSVELRENSDFDIYYKEGGKQDEIRVSGTWELLPSNKIKFDFKGNGTDVIVEVIEFTHNKLVIVEMDGTKHILLRNI
ncbi:MAG: hypothetical protein AAGK97_06630 [Bacteroidota bacterium]